MPAPDLQVERVALPDEWRGAARRIGWALFVCWLVLGTSALFLGESRSTFAQLKQDVASGEVTEVQVTEGLGPGSKGLDLVEVHWRKGWFSYRTRVVEANPVDRGRRHVDGDDVTARVQAPTADRLHEIDPGVDVTTGSRDGFSVEAFDRSVPTWIGFAVALVWLATITSLIAAPRPWRATKWAWFWLLGILPPLGPFAYLAFGGPTGLAGPPGPGSRRLTGGWAFLISLVCGSVFVGASR